jgi:poly [ADP-ribose] polymerase 7/11/12/13
VFSITANLLFTNYPGQDHWKWASNGQDQTKLFDMDRESEEFKTVQLFFAKTMPCNIVLDAIQRIENGPQHDIFCVQRKNVRKDMRKVGKRFERSSILLLFHGTSESALDSIINSTSGFQPLLAGSATGAIWGDGTYFARDASYSDSYACRTTLGTKKMLAVKVLVGLTTQGKSGLKQMPRLCGGEYVCYHSLVDNVDNPSIFVVQQTGQGYPAYLITYH